MWPFNKKKKKQSPSIIGHRCLNDSSKNRKNKPDRSLPDFYYKGDDMPDIYGSTHSHTPSHDIDFTGHGGSFSGGGASGDWGSGSSDSGSFIRFWKLRFRKLFKFRLIFISGTL